MSVIDIFNEAVAASLSTEARDVYAVYAAVYEIPALRQLAHAMLPHENIKYLLGHERASAIYAKYDTLCDIESLTLKPMACKG